MIIKEKKKLIQEGEYVAEVMVSLIQSDYWSPGLSLEEAYKLDDVREALRKGDLKTASKFGIVYKMTPVDV